MTRRKKPELPVIDSCDGCGACCLEQNSPPGYLYILLHRDECMSGPFAEDVERVDLLPQQIIDGLREYGEQLLQTPPRGEQPCIWYDRQRRRCKHYEHRPSICRDALEPGDESCRAWRQQFLVKPF